MGDSSAAEAEAQRYQSIFPDVAGICSRDLLRDSLLPVTNNEEISWNLRGHKVLLVDVRTNAERGVSMIAGAVSFEEFKSDILPSLECKRSASYPDMIVTYCTIGYRSGMEASQLITDHPTLFVSWDGNDKGIKEEGVDSKTKVANLDGIIPFANGCLEYEMNNDKQHLIMNPKNKCAANKIHVYGPSWKKYLSPNYYEAVTFSTIEFAWRGAIVIFRSVLSRISSCVHCKR